MSASTDSAATLLEECLARCGTDQSTLLDSVRGSVDLHVDDRLLVVGSCAEGLGNSKSDLDLLLVAGDGRDEIERGWALGRGMVDLRVIRTATVEDLTSRVREWVGRSWNLLELAPFSYDERLLLHRLLEGHELHPGLPELAADQWRPGRTSLAKLKLQVARHMARTIQVDMVGYRDGLDYASLVFAAQDLLGHSIDGLLAGHYITNPNPKWRSRLLDRLPPDWERPLKIRPTGLRPGRVLWDLHRAPAAPERESAVSHALRCVTFARAVFAWAEPRLIGNADVESLSWGRVRQDDRPPGQPLPGLEFDVDFFLSRDGIAVGRLNEFGPSLRLSDREFALLLLCDGQTSAVEAETIINGGTNVGSEILDVGRTVASVARSGLLLEPDGVGPVCA